MKIIVWHQYCQFNLVLIVLGSLKQSFKPHSDPSFDLSLSAFVFHVFMLNPNIAVPFRTIMHPSFHSQLLSDCSW